MTINHHGSTAVITQDKTSLIEFSKKFGVLYERFKSEDLIIHLIDVSVGSLGDLVSLAAKHSISKHCFVIVNADLNPVSYTHLTLPTNREV